MEYRRGVAAYAATYGLAGMALPGFGVVDGDAQVEAVALETDDAVDDVRIETRAGHRLLVQAKRTLRRGSILDKVVAQWARAGAGASELDPTTRLVVVAAHLSGPIRSLKDVLERRRLEQQGALTAVEKQVLGDVLDGLDGLTQQQRDAVLRAAYVHELEVEEPDSAGSREARLALRAIVAEADTAEAWKALVRIAGRVARLRGGRTIPGWLQELQKEGVPLQLDAGSRAAEIEERRLALDRYLRRALQDGREVDLRALGANLPAIALSTIDAEVEVGIDPDDRRTTAALVWAHLRRGRSILTGLPGGGKSTALRSLAASLIELNETTPILVALKDVDHDHNGRGFRDRLLDAALREVANAERPTLRGILEDAIDSGDATLILDGLDETYDRRGDVIADLARFLRDVPEDCDVILATRDVGYGQARTLGWPELRLCEPSKIERSVRAVLEASAAERAVDASSIDDWVAERAKWVNHALASDSTLRETPLVPVLLSLLAAEKTADTLPKGRAPILSEMVNSVVRRHETRRSEGAVVPGLSGDRFRRALLDVFELEGTELVANRGRAPLAGLCGAAASLLADRWQLAPALAEAAGEEFVRFWDEAGVFVISGAEESVAPRLMLLAEIAAARAATCLSPIDIRAWVERVADTGTTECLILAAGLAPDAAGALADVAVDRKDTTLAHAMVVACRSGASISRDARDAVVRRLLEDANHGDREAWEAWVAATTEALSDDNLALARESLQSFPAEYEAIGTARLVLAHATEGELADDADALMAVLDVGRLPRLAQRSPDASPDRQWLVVDKALVSAVEGAARALLGKVPEATALVVKQAGQTSMALQRTLVSLLRERGFGDEATALTAKDKDVFARAFFGLADLQRHPEDVLLTAFAAWPHAALTRKQQRRLDELADLAETMNLNDVSSVSAAGYHQGRGVEVASLLLTLADVSPGVVAAQAAIIQERIRTLPQPGSAYFALFDSSEDLALNHWNAVTEKDAAFELLQEMFGWGLGSALCAARAIWGVPVPAKVTEQIRDLLQRFERSPRHQRVVAHVLASLVDGPEPEEWITNSNPTLRSVAAELVPGTVNAKLSRPLRALLADDDGNVRETAIERVTKLDASDVEEELGRAASLPDPGWRCISCLMSNPAFALGCRTEKCFAARPHPAKKAGEALAARRQAGGSKN